jgi:hypothetical protein
VATIAERDEGKDMCRVAFPVQIGILFLAGLSGGLVLQFAGALPGNPRAVVERWLAPSPNRPAAALRSSPSVTDIHPGSTTPVVPAPLAPAATQPEAAPLSPQLVSLLGDEDATRNTLRRAVIVTARAAMVMPCDIDRRAAFQMSLRDYARAWASSPRTVGERADFRTTLDAEAVRAIGAAHRAGLVEADLVARWRALERHGVEEILRRERRALSDTLPDACPTARRA